MGAQFIEEEVRELQKTTNKFYYIKSNGKVDYKKIIIIFYHNKFLFNYVSTETSILKESKNELESSRWKMETIPRGVREKWGKLNDDEFTGIAATASEIAEILFIIFIILFLVSLVFGWRRRIPPEL